MQLTLQSEDTGQRLLDERLDEALEESFPASDSPAVHPHYAAAGDKSVPLGTEERETEQWTADAETSSNQSASGSP